MHLTALGGERPAGRGGRAPCLKLIRWQSGGYTYELWGEVGGKKSNWESVVAVQVKDDEGIN